MMNYIRVACQSRQTLEQVFEDSVSAPVDRPSSSSSLSVQMSWMMELLESNLEAKSKIYRDSSSIQPGSTNSFISVKVSIKFFT